MLLDTFVQQVEEVFKKLPKPLEWRSFYRHDLNLIVDTAPREKKGKGDRFSGNSGDTLLVRPGKVV